MNTRTCLGTLAAVAFLTIPAATAAAAAARGVPPRPAPPLGLARLLTTTPHGQVPSLAPGRFALDELAPGGAPGIARLRRDGRDLLALAAGAEWTRPLRGAQREVAHVSFQLYASASTIVDIGGVRLGFTLSPAGHSLQLMYDDASAGAPQWKPLHLHLATEAYEGRNLAAVPTLTVRLDLAAQTWDLYSAARLAAGSLPLLPVRPPGGQFRLRAGVEGAWLSGLVFADDHPLFDDANANGIDDTVELRLRGGLLPAPLGSIDRQVLLREWREEQRRHSPPALYVDRPGPDRSVAPPRSPAS